MAFPRYPLEVPHSDPPPPDSDSEPEPEPEPQPERINHPDHYNNHPSGIEAIQVCEHMGFNLGNAIKYIWRADEKENAEEDIQKAIWYLQRELQRRKGKDQ